MKIGQKPIFPDLHLSILGAYYLSYYVLTKNQNYFGHLTLTSFINNPAINNPAIPRATVTGIMMYPHSDV